MEFLVYFVSVVVFIVVAVVLVCFMSGWIPEPPKAVKPKAPEPVEIIHGRGFYSPAEFEAAVRQGVAERLGGLEVRAFYQGNPIAARTLLNLTCRMDEAREMAKVTGEPQKPLKAIDIGNTSGYEILLFDAVPEEATENE